MTSKQRQHLFFISSVTFLVTVSAQTNLALQGTAEQQSTLIDSLGPHTANLAIEGPANNDWNDGCSSTKPNQAYVWWGLTLPQVAFITNVVIYYRGDTPDQMNDFRLYLSNTSIGASAQTLCYTDLSIPGYPNTTQDIDCYILAKNVYFFNRYKAIELCHITVNGCWKGSWGTNCTNPCQPKCIEQHCYPGNGSCVWGCDPHNCFNNKCDIHTGACTEGCVNGWVGKYCNTNIQHQ